MSAIKNYDYNENNNKYIAFSLLVYLRYGAPSHT